MTKKKLCSCGLSYSSRRSETLHRASIWHKNHRTARRMYKQGYSQSDIARVLKCTRSHIEHLFKQVGIGRPRLAKLAIDKRNLKG